MYVLRDAAHCLQYTAPLSALLPFLGLAFGFKRKGDGGLSEDDQQAFNSLVEATFDGVMVAAPDGIMEWADERLCDLLGMDAEEVEGTPFTSFLDPTDVEKAEQYLGRTVEKPQNFEIRVIDRQGGARRLQITATADGEQANRIYLGFRDITEEESLKRRLAFTEKVDLLGRLMSGVGGDLRRVVSALEDSIGKDGATEATVALARLKSMEARLNAFPPRGIRGGAEVSAATIATDLADSVRQMSGVAIELEIQPNLPSVFGDAGQLKEALSEIVDNAVEAVGQNDGEVSVNVRSFKNPRATPRKGFILPVGEFVQITISDTGSGIQPEILDHVFEPLFSTRTSTALAGLGLAAAYTIMKNHRGYIEMDSAPGSGTTVEVFLPRSRVKERIGAADTGPAVAEAAEQVESDTSVGVELADTAVKEVAKEATKTPKKTKKIETAGETADTMGELEQELAAAVESVETNGEAESETPAAAPAGEGLTDKEVAGLSGHETVLIIEEDTEVRGALEDMLSQFGYNALPARNWVEGVDLFKRHARLVNLVCLNIQVPEMVWVKTLMDLRKVAPQASVMLMGGAERSHTVQRYVDLDGIHYLEKPITLPKLLTEVRAALDALAKTAEE